MRVNPPLPTRARATARSLRRNGTDAESELWYRLRAGRLHGLKFRRQHPLPPYVVDFYCEELKLIIELDGSQHSLPHDATRNVALEMRGMTILRFWDNQVLREMDSVLQAIFDFTQTRTLTPTPPPKGEGL